MEPRQVLTESPARKDTVSSDFRETMIRVHGVERVIRTERAGSVKRLESAHTKAVKEALVELSRTVTEQRDADELASLHAAKWPDKEGFPGSGQRSRDNAVVQAETRHMTRKRRTFGVAPSSYVDARKGWPKVTFTASVPDYFVEVAPGEYATAEAAESMGATEHTDEVLPGVTLQRYGKGWTLYHLASADEEHPQGRSLGVLFKTRKRAREVSLTDLAGLDFTRPAEELVADEETAAVMKVVKLREFLSASKRNAWSEADLRAAEVKLAELGCVVAA